MVKLQKRYAYTYKGKDHYKHIVTIPEDVIVDLGWKSDMDLQPKVENNRLVLRDKKDSNNNAD